MNTRSKWFLLPMAALTAGLVFAAACGGDDDDEGGDTTPGATSEATTGTGAEGQAPADQQKIVIAIPEPEFFDPHKSNFEQDIAVERMLFRGLYNLTDDGEGGVKVEPMMAEGEPQVTALTGSAVPVSLSSQDGATPTKYTIKLKSGIKWSDGEPVTAADFVYGIQRECDPDVASPYQYLLGAGIGEVVGCDALTQNTDPAQKDALLAAIGATAVDDSTLEITTNKPVATFTTIFALWPAFPARQDVIEEFGDAWTQPGNIVTNGPFTISDYVAADHVTLVPNENWSGAPAALQEIQIKFVDDLSAAFRQFQNDELGVTEILATDAAVATSQGLEDNLLIVPTARITVIEAQMNNEVLKEFGVRLAISQAIDREALVSSVYDGIHTPAYYWTVKGLVGYQGNEPFESVIGFAPDKAAQTLADAGYPNGEGIPTLRWTARDNEQRRNEFAFVQKALKDTLNINIEANFVDSQTRSAAFNAEDFDLFPGGWQLDYPDIENPLVGLFNTDGGQNHYNCSDPDVDAKFEEAANATSDEARIQAYQDIETLIVTKLCGIIPLYQDSRPFLVASNIGGIVPNGTIDAGLPGTYCIECWYVKAD